MIALLRDTIKYDVRPVNGPGPRGELLVKSKDGNVKRLYSPVQAPQIPLLPDDRVSLDSNGLPVVVRELGQYITGGVLPTNDMAQAAAMFGVSPGMSSQISSLLSSSGLSPAKSQQVAAQIVHNANSGVVIAPGGTPNDPVSATAIVTRELDIPIGQMMLDAQRSAQVAEQQLAGDVQAIDAYNAPILESNQRIRAVLHDAVGADVGADPAAWQKWLVNLLGYAYSAPRSYDDQPTVVEDVPLEYQPQAAPFVIDQPGTTVVLTRQQSCFGAGTAVQTLDGLHPIEKLRAGDLVLTQEPTTGELKYQPLVAVYHNPPNATFRIELDEEAIVATGIHRFWKAGRGWVMARELKPGDALRTVGGLAVVKSVVDERTQPVFNLRVAEGESFFVGRTGVLAHDNSLVNPTPSPFDAVRELGAPVTP